MSPVELDWKLISKIGAPTVIAIWLIYFLTNIVSSGISAQNSKIEEHARVTASKLERIEEVNTATLRSMRLLTSVSTQMCVNQAKNDYQRSACLEAAK